MESTAIWSAIIRQVFGGANRSLSEKYGLVVNLCHECHNEPPDGVHFNAENMLALRKWAQKQADRQNSISDRRADNELYKKNETKK